MHKIIRDLFILPIAVVLFVVAGSFSYADNTVMVGGEAMYPTKDIVTNAVNSEDHTTLITAVKAAGLVGNTSGRWPIYCVCSYK